MAHLPRAVAVLPATLWVLHAVDHDEVLGLLLPEHLAPGHSPLALLLVIVQLLGLTFLHRLAAGAALLRRCLLQALRRLLPTLSPVDGAAVAQELSGREPQPLRRLLLSVESAPRAPPAHLVVAPA